MADHYVGSFPYPDFADVPDGPDSFMKLAQALYRIAGAGTGFCNTIADRDALVTNGYVFQGLEVYVLQTDTKYKWTSGAVWVQTGLATSTDVLRVSGNTVDNFSSGSFAVLVAGTLVGAPAGKYHVFGNAELSSSGTAIGTVRLTAGSTNVANDNRRDTTANVRGEYISGIYAHPGGDLAISLNANVSAGTGAVTNAGTHVGAFRVGS